VESIEEVSKIIKRAPVIWDNIHANDYDQKRLFLGPYKGRSTELIPRLKGVLTNPNCEFEANYVAIHTLATWYKSNMNGVRKDVVMSKYRGGPRLVSTVAVSQYSLCYSVSSFLLLRYITEKD
jgi:protein O-GlcNAcase/histone acetyltransferase